MREGSQPEIDWHFSKKKEKWPNPLSRRREEKFQPRDLNKWGYGQNGNQKDMMTTGNAVGDDEVKGANDDDNVNAEHDANMNERGSWSGNLQGGNRTATTASMKVAMPASYEFFWAGWRRRAKWAKIKREAIKWLSYGSSQREREIKSSPGRSRSATKLISRRGWNECTLIVQARSGATDRPHMRLARS